MNRLLRPVLLLNALVALSAAGYAQSAAPVMDPIPDKESWFYNGGAHMDYSSLSVHASNSPTSYTASGAPAPFYDAASNPGFSWVDSDLKTGEFTVTVTATNAAGSGSTTFHWIVHPALITPFVGDKSKYVEGDLLNLSAKFTCPVKVSGTPYVELWDGKRALYHSGSGTDTLFFQYQSTSADAGKTATPYWIQLGGGNITTLGGTTAQTDVPSAPGYMPPPITVAAAPGAPVFGPAPDLDSAYLRANNLPEFGEYKIQISNNPTTVTATAHPGTFHWSSGAAVFDWEADNLTGGDIPVTVTASNSVGTTSTTFHWIIHPGVNDFIRSDKLTYTVGDTITFTASFSAPVVVTGTPYVQLWGTKRANYVSGSGTDKLQFQYTVAADDPVQSGLYVEQIQLGDGTIAMVNGVTAKNLYASAFTIFGHSAGFSIVAPPPGGGMTPQTITFTSPVSAVMIGQPITLGATSSAGLPISYSVVSGNATLTGNVLTPQSTATLIVRASSAGDSSYAAASTDVNFGTPQKAVQAISITTPQRVEAGSTTTLNATASSGLPISYTLIGGPATLSGNSLTVTGTSGTILVRAAQSGSDTYAAANDVTLQFDIGPLLSSRLVNISSRLRVSANDTNGASIAGFVITGDAPKPILIRAVGPTLSAFGIGSPLPNPQLKLFNGKGAVLATNAGWANDAAVTSAGDALGAFRLGTNSADAAILTTLPPGNYTVQVTSGNSGTALIEVYDAQASTASTKELINISTRGTVGAGDDVLIGGFVVSGDAPKRVLIRGIGPALTGFGVAGAVSDPVLKIYDAKSVVIAQNDDWGTPQPLNATQSLGSAADISAASTAVGAFALSANSHDAVLLLTLNPGQYSAVVTGANNTGGAAMVEIYEVP